jgi:hypothetical protein
MLKLVTGDSGKMQWKQEMQLIEILDSLFWKAQENRRAFLYGDIYIYKFQSLPSNIYYSFYFIYIRKSKGNIKEINFI